MFSHCGVSVFFRGKTVPLFRSPQIIRPRRLLDVAGGMRVSGGRRVESGVQIEAKGLLCTLWGQREIMMTGQRGSDYLEEGRGILQTKFGV